MIPLPRALWLAAVSLVPAALALVEPSFATALWLIDATLLAAVLVDFFRAPRAPSLQVRRVVDPVLSSGRANTVTLELTSTRRVRGELRELVTPGPQLDGHRQRFDVDGFATMTYRLTPSTRGDLQLGPVTVRAEGPWRLCARQWTLPLVDAVKVFPDLTALSHDAVTLARAEQQAMKVQRVRAEGREFESLRDYRVGDDRRSIDWKATARRGKPLVRIYRPERNQHVVVLLDCGRHMAGELEGRRKLDHAVDATLRLARVAIDQGDLVGVLAFSRDVKAWLPPRKGAAQLRAIAQALYRVEATLEESDYGAALDTAFARGARRSLVVVMTDLLDPEATRALTVRTRKLVPRHLPLVVSLQDADVHRAATAAPTTVDEAYQRVVAGRLEHDSDATVLRLRAGGAHVVREPPTSFASAGVAAYLDVKARGLL